MKNILTFKEITNEHLDVAVLGGKAIALAQLYQNGFPVPDGFVLTTEFFDTFEREKCQIKFSSKDVINIYDCIDRYCRDGIVAIRSSASVEDASGQSFAGQFDSFLNIKKGQVLETIKKCWRSQNNARAQSYAQDKSGIKMAVIVQKMLTPKVSGVTFSAHPVTGDTNSMVIEAVLGNGEPLVQGTISPDHYVISKQLEILDKNTFTDNENDHLKLSEFQLQEVARLAIKVSQFFQMEVDIEWAIEGDKLYILQCRPITTI